jgi:iron uptake system EfeUOB component EfeO/EfeM
MSIKQTTVKASLLTVLCLSAALTMTSCGKKDTAETTPTTSTSTTTTTTTPAATTPAATTPAAAGGALSATEKAQLTPVKTALVMANTAVKSGDMTKAKAQFDKFSTLLPAVEPILKAKAGASYPAIENGIKMVKTAMGSATPDKAKAGEGLKTVLDGMNALLAKK